MRAFAIWLLLVLPAWAAADEPGEFDYYVLALSWSPNWCAREGDARGSDQCHPRHDHGWILHGLWPQYDRGWPSFCRTATAPPSRGQTRAMADIMGTSGLAWHQWKKHGTCSGLDPEAYFAVSRRAYEAISRPAVFRRLDTAVRLPANVIEEAFLRDNPDLTAEMVTVTCKSGYVAEVRICLSRDARTPVPCGADVRNDCRLDDALFTPIR